MSTTHDVVITREPTGNVTAEGGDELAFTLLKRAGFVIETAPLSFWYRLPWDMGEKRENQMASHAARMSPWSATGSNSIPAWTSHGSLRPPIPWAHAFTGSRSSP
ncbi:hypothetical protein JG491_08580 [Streptomyces sp. CRPSP2-6A1]|uniref:hypothetical protein n=1 Tax=Streptomyces sp. CRPSP2-6A1 TaxID=2799588 RepID=UPI0018F0C65F|nr:hypothetical protein [Streptomyces sp. CRPSP2-6A1]MBJ7000129.1 hypothetical protein [Streptomyces sp. CRPSP2-6A1]